MDATNDQENAEEESINANNDNNNYKDKHPRQKSGRAVSPTRPQSDDEDDDIGGDDSDDDLQEAENNSQSGSDCDAEQILEDGSVQVSKKRRGVCAVCVHFMFLGLLLISILSNRNQWNSLVSVSSHIISISSTLY